MKNPTDGKKCEYWNEYLRKRCKQPAELYAVMDRKPWIFYCKYHGLVVRGILHNRD